MKLFFLDIDGTITLPGTPPSQRLARVIDALRAQGDKVFLCTGRSHHSVPELVKPLDRDGGIFSAGGLVLAGDQEIYRAYLSAEKKGSILALLDQLGACYILECEEHSYRGGIDPQDLLTRISPKEGMHSELLRVLSLFNQYLPVEQYRGQPVFKIVFLLPSQSSAERLRAARPGGTDVVFFRNLLASEQICLGEISDAAINKGNAMGRMCAFYGMTPQDCIAYGDSMNDASILQLVAEGIAMGNANEEVKALASRVCGNCSEDGLAIDLQRYLRTATGE